MSKSLSTAKTPWEDELDASDWKFPEREVNPVVLSLFSMRFDPLTPDGNVTAPLYFKDDVRQPFRRRFPHRKGRPGDEAEENPNAVGDARP